jgi:predicted dehydrogenase
LGSVHLVKVFNMKNRNSIGKKPDGQPPEGVDYDRWLGPAPKVQFNPNRFHYNWHWYWDYSGGDIINDGVHQMDIARWLIGRDYPKSVTATGGKHFHDDDQETPDTHIATFDFDKLTMVFELTLWTPYMAKTPWDFRNTDAFPPWLQNSTRIEVYGTKGMMMMGRHGGGWQVFGAGMKEVAKGPGRRPLAHHFENFFECIKSRKQPNSYALGAHQSTILCHLANYSYRVGGQKLIFDGKTETIVNCPEAQKLAKRVGREPYQIPEIA